MKRYSDLVSLQNFNEESFLRFAYRKISSDHGVFEACLPNLIKLKRSISPNQFLAELDIRSVLHNALNEKLRLTEGQGGLAIISPMTPANTGVATCNLKSLLESQTQVDIFSVWNDLEEYLNFKSSLQIRLAAYPFSMLQFFAANRCYETLVMSVGNSDHNLFAVIDASNFEYRSCVKNFVLHLHDGCVWNLVDKLLSHQNRDFPSIVLSAYSLNEVNDLQSIFHNYTERWQQIDALVNRGLYGLKILLEIVRPTRVVVNSSFAADMIRSEFVLEVCRIPVDVAFHPVFNSDTRNSVYLDWAESKSLRIGSFGIPSNGKGTDLIVDACRDLQAQGINVNLILAGFGVTEYLAKNPDLAREMDLEIHSDVADDELLELMDGVHLAVQLRKNNLGESSGVISTLIKKCVPLIASANGSFLEYKDCCVLAKDGITAKELSILIIDTMKSGAYRGLIKRQQRYSVDHSSQILCEKLFLIEKVA